ncbi:helix-turn-helix domain-containing protein [Halobaculum sp. MBLA0147]|uniref:helix-turn-helix domain-containing protein n=1 Tax=Halobaculum sp. MBLA0147 TaxID=3079934 RepID=UPI003524AD29
MPDPISEDLREELDCLSLLESFHGLKELDRQVFVALADSEDPLTVKEIGDVVDRERSTAYRAVQRLLEAGYIQKEQVNYEEGGYYHVYRVDETEAVADEMQRMLNDWYAKMGQLIDEFREEYADQETTATHPEQ